MTDSAIADVGCANESSGYKSKTTVACCHALCKQLFINQNEEVGLNLVWTVHENFIALQSLLALVKIGPNHVHLEQRRDPVSIKSPGIFVIT